MSFSGFLYSLFGIPPGVSRAERSARHQEFRKAVDSHRNAVAEAIGQSAVSKRISGEALASLKETVKDQETVARMTTEQVFLRRLRDFD